jgi:NADH-quinone oxidoreductase subunit C
MPPLNSAPSFADALKAQFGAKILGVETQTGREVVLVEASAWAEVVRWMKESKGFDLLMELAGGDYSGFPGHTLPPLCVTAMLFGTQSRERAWLKAFGPLDGFKLPTLSALYAGANWYERECFDMYGVLFDGHPYLKRLLLYDEFQGAPLRKDYPILKMQPLIPMRNAVDYESIAVAKRQAEGKA